MRYYIVVHMLFCTLLLPGCWDRTEINNMSFVLALGIEKTEAGDMKITVQVPKPSELVPMAAVSQKPYWVISGEGRNLFEARSELALRAPRELYFAHNIVVIFDRALAEEGLKDYVDFLSRDFELRQSVWILITDDLTPEQVLTFETETEEVPALGLARLLERSREHGKSGVRTLHEFIKDGSAEYRATKGGIIRPVPTIEFPEGDEISPPPAGEPQVPYDLSVEGAALFVDKQLKTILDGDQTLGLQLAMGRAKRTLLTFAWPTEAEGDQYVSLEITRNSAKVDGEFVNGQPRVTVEVEVEFFLAELESPVDLLDVDKLGALEAAAQAEVERLVQSAVRETQRAGCDIMSLGLPLAMQDRAWWRQHRADWPAFYSTLQVEYEVKVGVEGTEIRARQRR